MSSEPPTKEKRFYRVHQTGTNGARTYRVEASSEDEAAQLVIDGKGEFLFEDIEVTALTREPSACIVEVEDE